LLFERGNMRSNMASKDTHANANAKI
jgi:hypothetical protein